MSFVFEALSNQEAIEYFRAKGYAPALSRFSWRDVWADEHDRMFTVAKAMREDVLRTIRAELDSAIADGRTYEDFRAAITPKLKELGWWGKQAVVDPRTGLPEEAQLGSARRLRIIYDTNLRTANAAGRWRRAQRNKALMPFFTYVQIDRPSKREAHEPFHGVTLPVDHPFWRTHWPPNGWLCGCIVRQISRRTLEREGLSLTEDTAVERVSETRPWHDRRNGVTRQVPKGIDPSFERNAGIDRFGPEEAAAPDPAARRLGQVERGLARALSRDPVERLAAVDLESGARLGANARGERDRVALPPALRRAAEDPARRIAIVHSHPDNAPLSAADLSQLARPGVARVIAVGADGSRLAVEAIAEITSGHIVEADAASQTLARKLVRGGIGREDANALLSLLMVEWFARKGLVSYIPAWSAAARQRYGALIDLVSSRGAEMFGE